MTQPDAGPELDAEVGRIVFGLRVVHLADDESRPCSNNTGRYIGGWVHGHWFVEDEAATRRIKEREGNDWNDDWGLAVYPVPSYSTDDAAAWDIVRRMREQPFSIRHRFVFQELPRVVSERLASIPNNPLPTGDRIQDAYVWFLAEPVDICLAALAAWRGRSEP